MGTLCQFHGFFIDQRYGIGQENNFTLIRSDRGELQRVMRYDYVEGIGQFLILEAFAVNEASGRNRNGELTIHSNRTLSCQGNNISVEGCLQRLSTIIGFRQHNRRIALQLHIRSKGQIHGTEGIDGRTIGRNNLRWLKHGSLGSIVNCHLSDERRVTADRESDCVTILHTTLPELIHLVGIQLTRFPSHQMQIADGTVIGDTDRVEHRTTIDGNDHGGSRCHSKGIRCLRMYIINKSKNLCADRLWTSHKADTDRAVREDTFRHIHDTGVV